MADLAHFSHFQAKRGRSRARFLALALVALLIGVVTMVGGSATARAQPAVDVVANSSAAEHVVTAASPGVDRLGSAQATASIRVCAPNGKCVYTSNYCTIASGCSKALYKEWPAGVYCSSSVGCFTYGGKNYSYIGGPVATADQRVKAAQCAVGIGFAAVTAGAGGPAGVTVAGVALSIWGCL